MLSKKLASTKIKQKRGILLIKWHVGTGNINFKIKSVEVEFATVVDKNISGEIGLKIPYGPAGAGSIGPDYKGSYEFKGTNSLDYTYYVKQTPDDYRKYSRKSQQDYEDSIATIEPSAVIAPTLAALRTGLMHATQQLPCMDNTPDNKNNTFTFSVELTR